MAVKIRLARRGRKKLAIFDVVVADARSPRDGRFIEKLGTYNPNTNPASIILNEDKALEWLMNGAQPSDTVRAMLSYKGVLLRKHLQIGVNKGAITQDIADGKFNEWQESKVSKITGKVDTLVTKQEADKKARLEAEAKKNTARAEALAKKNIVPEDVPAEAPVAEAEAAAEETPVAAVTPAEIPVEEAAAEATPTPEAAEAEAPAAAEEAPFEDVLVENPVAEAAPEEAPVAVAAADGTPVEEAAVDATPTPEAAEAETPTAEEAVVAEAPAEEVPVAAADEAPVEEAAAEATPTPEAAEADAPAGEEAPEDKPTKKAE